MFAATEKFSHFELKSVEHREWFWKFASDSDQNNQIPLWTDQNFPAADPIENLGRSQLLFSTFTEENKILASFPFLSKLESHRCWLDRDGASFLFHIW